ETGRRIGLKIRSSARGVWVRIPPRAPFLALDALPQPVLEQVELAVFHLREAPGTSLDLCFPCRDFRAARELRAARLQLVVELAVLAAELPDVVERAPVYRTRADAAYRVLVRGGGVALVARETVAGIDGVELGHQPVAIDLRHDRR